MAAEPQNVTILDIPRELQPRGIVTSMPRCMGGPTAQDMHGHPENTWLEAGGLEAAQAVAYTVGQAPGTMEQPDLKEDLKEDLKVPKRIAKPRDNSEGSSQM